MERETLGTEILIYGATGLMLLVAYVKRKSAYIVKPFKKPLHIPEHLIKKRAIHSGLVTDIEQKGFGTVLLISQRPLIPLFKANERLLSIKLPGVKVNGNGMSWLQNCIKGREAIFIPLTNRVSNQFVVSQLCLVHPLNGNRLLDVSETLLKLGFAHFGEDITDHSKKNAKYYQHLAHVESKTKVREAFLAKISKYPKISKAFYDFKASLLSKKKLVPELVR